MKQFNGPTSSYRLGVAAALESGCDAVVSGRREWVRPSPGSAHRRTGFGGAIHPGGQGDTIRQLIHRSGGGRGCRGGGGQRFLGDTISLGGGKLCVGRGASFSFKDFRNHKNRDCGAILFSVFFFKCFPDLWML